MRKIWLTFAITTVFGKGLVGEAWRWRVLTWLCKSPIDSNSVSQTSHLKISSLGFLIFGNSAGTLFLLFTLSLWRFLCWISTRVFSSSPSFSSTIINCSVLDEGQISCTKTSLLVFSIFIFFKNGYHHGNWELLANQCGSELRVDKGCRSWTLNICEVLQHKVS